MLDNLPLGRKAIDTTPFYDDEFCRLAETSSLSQCLRVCISLALKGVSFEHDKREIICR
jgi:hypothetical protein